MLPAGDLPVSPPLGGWSDEMEEDLEEDDDDLLLPKRQRNDSRIPEFSLKGVREVTAVPPEASGSLKL